jgi:hypothetical protein
MIQARIPIVLPFLFGLAVPGSLSEIDFSV